MIKAKISQCNRIGGLTASQRKRQSKAAHEMDMLQEAHQYIVMQYAQQHGSRL